MVDRYRYWRNEAIVADLDRRRHPFHVAIENWQHDMNIGSVVRNANAFLAAEVHIVGRRRWNKRGAMVTDRYQHVRHHGIDRRASWRGRATRSLRSSASTSSQGAQPIDDTELPERCVLLFGQEGPGLSDEARAAVERICSIPQFGSTRSINAGVASGIAMYEWVRRHGDLTTTTTRRQGDKCRHSVHLMTDSPGCPGTRSHRTTWT